LIYTCRIGRRGAKIRGKPEFLQWPEGFKTVFCLSNSLTLNIFYKQVHTSPFIFSIIKFPHIFSNGLLFTRCGNPQPGDVFFLDFFKVISYGKYYTSPPFPGEKPVLKCLN
jgi:hypothetical protein